MISTLKNLSSDTIRKNWNNIIENNKNIINSHIFEIIWSEWEFKHAEFTKNIFYHILKIFISGYSIGKIELIEKKKYIIQEDNDKLILKCLDNNERKQVHKLCDKIGLHHKSIKKKNKKHLYIYKPSIWLWEYTEKNPYSKSDEYYKLLEETKMIQNQKYKLKMEKKYCNCCDRNGLEVQLYCSVYIKGLYCDDCLDTLSDGYGGKLNDHKFEPI